MPKAIVRNLIAAGAFFVAMIGIDSLYIYENSIRLPTIFLAP